ncbi:MAG: tetratricopeptide repeat protein [Chitinophagaceae bacterium]|nr:tetratricopeptide repeat protein [Chitinophagaceae bacterium]
MRKLAAIMFTDMVGYSALTQSNEALALELLSEHREILRPFFTKHQGNEIETAGDSFFVEFNSAVEAVNCAIEIQQQLHERNKTESAERNIRIRIGIHIGDVVHMDNHVHGDGVNIAARIEPKAQPGGICLSEDVARQIRNKISYPITKYGEEKLKNITMPMEIYRVNLPWLAPLPKTKTKSPNRVRLIAGVSVAIILIVVSFLFIQNQGAIASPKNKFRLAVLPLKNISNNQDDEYFADGMTEELISSISKISGLNVIARTSTMRYKQTSKDISQIGRELSVGTVLEGSVRKIANKARITVQLIDAENQENLWSMDYDRELSDIFSIQSEIATSIAKELKVLLAPAEKEQLDKSLTNNVTAYQEYLIGKHNLNKRTSESIQAAIIHFEKSVEEDPLFALPYTQIAYCYTLVGAAGYGNVPRPLAESKARSAVMKALELDSMLAEAHAALGYMKFRIDWDWAGAEKSLKKAIELKPSYSTAHEWYGLMLGITVRLDEALREMKTAYELDPLSPSVSNGLARVYHFRQEDKKALQQVMKTLELEPDYAEGHFSMGMSYFRLKDYENAEKELEKAIQLSGRRPVMLGMLGRTLLADGKKEEAKKLLDELQSPPSNNDKLYAGAIILNYMGHDEEAFKIFEKLVEEKYGIMLYLRVERPLFSNSLSPRYKQLLTRMGLE